VDTQAVGFEEGAVSVRRLRSPWSRIGEAREVLAMLSAGRLSMVEFADRFGTGALDAALDGDAEHLVAWLLALEAALELIPAVPADPVLAALTPPSRCPHIGEDGVTFDLDARVAGCDECLPALREALSADELVAQLPPRPADHLDRCVVCDDLAELVELRVLLGTRWIIGRACESCAAFTGQAG